MRIPKSRPASLDLPIPSLPANGRTLERNGHAPDVLIRPAAEAESPRQSRQNSPKLRIVIIGLSITSSWGNGHATTYRALVRELTARGHQVLFLERDQPWYAANRDLPAPPYGRTELYHGTRDLKDRFSAEIQQADFVLVGSYVQDGANIGQWVTKASSGATGFYDIDTPVTLANLAKSNLDYLSAAVIPRYSIYLSFTGGPTLDFIEKKYGAPKARPLYCSVDTSLYYPEPARIKWDLGYMGTYSDDRQPALDELLMQPARCWDSGRFVVAGPQYPRCIRWPANTKRFTHLSPAKHRAFYNAQRFTLNITRADMVEAGFSPSVRLFEAAACGTPIISDCWEGLQTFFTPGEEILLSYSSEESLYYLLEIPEDERRAIGQRARTRVLSTHTAKHRARELENYVLGLLKTSVPEPAD